MNCAITVLKNIGITLAAVVILAVLFTALFTVAVSTMSLLGLNGFPAFMACCVGWIIIGFGTISGIAECKGWE